MPTTKKAKKTTRKAAPKQNYDKPELREKLKNKIMKGTRGGRAGEWSARKAQLLAHEYEAAGGGYTGPRSKGQKSLKKWGDEKWHTSDDKPAKRGKTMARYLPDKAWDKLSESEKRATNTKKEKVSRTGTQFVRNTKKAAKAGKSVRAKSSKKALKKTSRK